MIKHPDVVIVGAGLSGLYTALCLNRNHKIIILAKTEFHESNSSLAQGGIAAEMIAEEVLLKNHVEDTLKAGHYQNRKEAVNILVEEAQLNIEKLLKFNVTFDIDHLGKFKMTTEGGHSVSRVLHSGGDATGKTMIEALYKETIRRDNITIMESMMAVDILHVQNEIIGITALDLKNHFYTFYAHDIILATGGIGAIYASTTNAPIATGDGIAMAKRVGAKIEKMAFVQFHPTAFYDIDEKSIHQRFLISEALRGEGAILRNIENEAFMKKYHDQADLAPRDIVSQAIHREMYNTWCDYVYLDTTHLERGYLRNRFPNIDRYLETQGYKLGESMIPVRPVAHFNIGGVKTDLKGETSIPHLYAVGECASTGVHGANRLASNSLLECVVFGKRIAKHINAQNISEKSMSYKIDNVEAQNFPYNPIRNKLRRLMDEYAGIVRTKKGLTKAKEELKAMEDALNSHPNPTVAYYETLNMVMVALLVIEDALNETKSIGCHYRLD